MSKAENPFRYFHSSPEVIRMAVMLYVRYPLSLRNVEGLLFERGYDLCHETVRFWWNRFGPMFAADIRRQRVLRMRGFRHWRWHLDEVPAPGSTASGTTCGGRSITKAKCLKAMSRRSGINLQLCAS